MVKYAGLSAIIIALLFTFVETDAHVVKKEAKKENKTVEKVVDRTTWTDSTYKKRDKLIKSGISKETATSIITRCKSVSQDPVKCIDSEVSKLQNKFPEQAQVIDTFKYGKYHRNVVNIPVWQKDIMDKNKVPLETGLVLRTLNTAECGDENGFCLTTNRETGRTIDCGFFQVNQIHGESHKWCVGMVKNGKAQVEEAKKSGNWSEVIKTRNELYEAQMIWTWGRMKSQVTRFDLPENREKRVYKLAKLHNGGKHKEDYASKAVISYKILKSYYSKY